MAQASKGQALAILLSGLALLAGAKKSYENVNHEILIEAYWQDAQPASNIVPRARSHDREEQSHFESRSYERFTPSDLAKALFAPDMKALNLLRDHATVQRDGQSIELDLDALRRYVASAKSNPDAVDAMLFKSGFLVFALAREDGFTDIIVPIDPAIVEGLVDAVKSVK